MKRYAKYERRRLGDRFDLAGYIPPQQLVEIAADRTAGLMGAYLWKGARAGDLSLLVRSCYMQGVQDATEALVRSGLRVVPKEDGSDGSI